MFKYISIILKRFSPAQRIIVLMLLLVTIIMVLSVPKIVDSLTIDNTELTKRIETQDVIIQDLNRDVIKLNNSIDTLNNKLRVNQIECTNLVIRREKEILDQISKLQRNVINSVPVKIMDEKSVYDGGYDESLVKALKGMEEIKVGIDKSIKGKR